MDNKWKLPESIEIAGTEYRIRTDFRAVIDILTACSDPELTEQEKTQVLFEILYVDYEKIPYEHIQEAIQKANDFIDFGVKDDGRSRVRLMDWEQDVSILAPAVNKVLGQDVRSSKNLHWWTFIGAYMEVGDSLFSQVVNIRNKKAKGKKLEKYEQEFYRTNKHLVDFKTKEQHIPEEQKDELRKLFGFKK